MTSSARRGAAMLAVGCVLAVGAVAGCSETVAPTVDAGAPDSLRVTTVGMRAVRVEWQEAPNALTRYTYRIERRAALSGPFEVVADAYGLGDGGPLYLDTEVEPETYYGYRVSGISPLGVRTGPTVVRGTRTAPWPGVRVAVVTASPTPTSADPDGYLVTMRGGRDTLVQRLPANGHYQFARLTPGTWALEFRGLAENCRTDDAMTRQVVVPDEGVNTVVSVTFAVNCRDTKLGAVRVEASVTGDSVQGGNPKVALTGILRGPRPTDSAVVSLASGIDATGGTALFENLRPGNYEVALDDVAVQCTIAGGTRRTVQVDTATTDTVRVAITCPNRRRVDNSGRPYHVKNEWIPQQAATGAKVALKLSIDMTRAPGEGIFSIDLDTRYDSLALRYDSATASASFGDGSSFNGAKRGLVIVSPKNNLGVTGVAELVRLHFTVLGASGGTVATTTTPKELYSKADTLIRLQSVHLVEDTLTIGTGGSTPPPGGGTPPPSGANRAPVAHAGGPYAPTVNVPVTLTAALSTDPDNNIDSYFWTFAGGAGAPGAKQGSTVQATFTAAGSYTATLIVADVAGLSDTATATIVVAASSTPPPPPPPPPPGSGVTLSGAFGAITQVGANREVELIVSLDLSNDLPETPGAEILASWKLDTLRWDPTRLRFQSLRFGQSAPGSNKADQSGLDLGWIAMEGAQAAGLNDRGVITLAKLTFVVLGAGGSSTTVTRVGKVQGAASTGGFSYLGKLTIREGVLTIP